MATNNTNKKTNEVEIPDILANIPRNTPVTMLNLLRYSEQANYPANFKAEPCSGKHAYTKRYLSCSKVHVANAGATILFEGPVVASLICAENEQWDSMIIVTYPSIEAFMQMAAAPEYTELAIHRAAGLEDSRLIASVQGELIDL